MVAAWITRQLVFDGFISGLLIGVLAVGLVLVFRSSRVVNFAVGNLGTVGAALLALVAINYGMPYWVAALAALVAGTVLGVVIELVVVRRLFNAARVTLLVATIGVAQLCQAILAALPKVKGLTAAKYPLAVQGPWQVAGVRIGGAQLTTLVVVPVVVGALAWFLNRTVIGAAVTASSDNPRLARTIGVNPKLVSTLVWGLAGLLSTITLVLASAQSGRVSGITTLGPGTMVRALAAAVIAGMVSFRGALVAGVAIGVVQAVVRFNFLEQTGLIDILVFVAVLVAVWVKVRRDEPDSAPMALRTSLRPLPERVGGVWWVRHLGAGGFTVLFALGAVLPIVISAPSRVLLYTTILCTGLCAVSITMLTGWAGQVSLGQMAFAGFGALVAAALLRSSLPFLLAIVVAAAITAAAAAIVGAGALRVHGLLLAVITFAMGIAAAAWVYRQQLFSDGNKSSVPFRRGSLFGLDLTSQRSYYYVVLVALGLTLLVAGRLRASGIGRTTIAVRDNAIGAAAYTVGALRVRVVMFALSGGIAGLGGALLAGAVQNVPLTERFFQVDDSLQLISIAVIGGLGTLIGPVLGSLWVIGLPAFFPSNEVLPFLASGVGLLVLLLYVPGGFAQLVHGVRDAVVRVAERRLGPEPPRTAPATTAVRMATSAPRSDSSTLALVTRGLTVRFGGKLALDGVDVHVQRGEIVGLIGSNGAGKSTFLNVVGGFIAGDGQVLLDGVDITGRSPARRAAAGLGRTFQAARLFPELSVRDVVLVALEARHRTPFAATALQLPHAVRGERRRRAEASDLLDLFGLGRYADRRTDELSTGTRRIVELAGLVAMGATMLCLDEPAAGVAQRETEALAPLLLEVRRQLDASMVVIEHDIPFISGLCDRIYCLEAGRVIAEGAPDVVRRDPLVIAHYLGTDTRSIDRSGKIRT